MGQRDQIENRQDDHRRAGGRWRRLRARAGDVGATFVEYALVFALLTVVSVPATQWLTDASRDEVNNEAECISRRPPPPGCQIPAVDSPLPPPPPGPDDPPDPGDPTDPEGPDPDDPTPPPPPPPPVPPSVASWSGSEVARRTSPTAWQVEAAPRVLNEGVPVAGALVQMRFQIAVPSTGEAFYVTCTTDASGTCPLVTWPVPYTDVTRVSLSVTMINSTPPTPSGSYPGTLCLQPDSPC